MESLLMPYNLSRRVASSRHAFHAVIVEVGSILPFPARPSKKKTCERWFSETAFMMCSRQSWNHLQPHSFFSPYIWKGEAKKEV
jgi:hypothetical protein